MARHVPVIVESYGNGYRPTRDDDRRRSIALTREERSDLVAFLRTL